MQIWARNKQVYVYIIAVTLAVLAAISLFTDNGMHVDGSAIKGEVLHSNYVLPHGGSDHGPGEH